MAYLYSVYGSDFTVDRVLTSHESVSGFKSMKLLPRSNVEQVVPGRGVSLDLDAMSSRLLLEILLFRKVQR